MKLWHAIRFDALMHPWFLALLIPVAALLAVECLRKAPAALSISTGAVMARIRGQSNTFPRLLPPLLRALGLAMLVLALARPLQGLKPHIDRADIVDIMLCVDVSESMSAMDFSMGGKPCDRLQITKAALHDFIESRKFHSEDRFGLDRLGLIIYAAYAWTQCPLTLDYGILERELAGAKIESGTRAKSGTAIGSAIGLAVGKLIKSEAKSKVIILLTDGLNNSGELDPITAAGIAKEYGIRIYTIGAGSQSEAPRLVQTIFGPQYQMVKFPMDEETLQKIAEVSGGRFYRATDSKALKEAYAEIDKLETTEIEVGDYYDHEEGFVPWAAMGSVAVAASLFTRRRWFEAIP